jgi:hypothetical protein
MRITHKLNRLRDVSPLRGGEPTCPHFVVESRLRDVSPLRGGEPHFRVAKAENGRGGEIRTRDLYVPNVALYQAKLRPDFSREGRDSLRKVGVASRKEAAIRLRAKSRKYRLFSEICELYCEIEDARDVVESCAQYARAE